MSSLDQLRRNLRDVHLRESLHRPHYPSPLSQSPLQASMSSASHTAASVASSSRHTVSTSTTPPSTSSRLSINQAFKSLTDEDIGFFDRLISTLPSHAADFSQLKSAYTAHLPEELDRRQRQAGTSRDTSEIDWDAHLWFILLSLVKVRGSNWRERWDSVRLAFGLDPNSGDETDLSATTQSTSQSVTGSSTQHGEESTSEPEWDESHRRYLQAATTTATSASALPGARNAALAQPSRTYLGLPRSSSPASVRPTADTLLSESSSQRNDLLRQIESQTRQSHRDDPISAIQARLSRLLNSDALSEDSSDPDSPDADTSIQASPKRDDAPYNPASHLPTDAKRRFDELVRSSQAERDRLRQSNLRFQEREEHDRWNRQLEMADQWRARRLLQMCLAWWITLTRQQVERMQSAADASARVTVDKAWERWRSQTQQELEVKRIGQKTDRVRCTLTAFRRWKRLAQIAAERKEDSRKEAMRTAYYTTTSAVKSRLAKQAFRQWKERHRTQVADGVRRRHLQAGAFALWQMRSSHTKQLQTREKVVVVKRNHSILTQAWDRWSDRFEENKALNEFQVLHNRLLASETLHIWRKLAMLSKLSQAFAERRLKLAALEGWKSALEQRQLRRKEEALAARWRARRLKQSILTHWRGRSQKISIMEEKALAWQVQHNRQRLHSVFHSWQLQSRAALLERVRAAGVLGRTFHHWKHRHTSLVTGLQQRESSIIQRRHGATLLTCFQQWRQRTVQTREREAQVEARRNETLCNDVFITWRNKQLEHRLLQQKATAVSDFFTLRSAMKQWRDRLRNHRADIKEASHDRRLVQQVFEIWKARSTKQQRLTTLLQHSFKKSDQALARSYLNQWVARIIEVRSRELEVKEQRERRLVKAAFYAWIEACLRHDDLLALMNSYIDVREEERKRRTFLHWLTIAREHKERRQNAEMLANSQRKKLLARTLTTWRDKLKERALATQEYDMLIRRQNLSLSWALNAWKAQTLLLPAVRMRNTSLKRAAFQHWQRSLPHAQMSNQAASIARSRRLQSSWQRWKESMRLKRQLRAAARFGAGSISVQRLRTLSAAAAANRSGGSSSPSAAQSSSPFRALTASSELATSARRPRTSLALLPPPRSDSPEASPDLRTRDPHPRDGAGEERQARREPSFARRSTSVPRHLESTPSAKQAERSGSFTRYREAESPSREAAVRRGRTAVAAATPTSESVSERSRFSLALQSSSSSISAAHELAKGAAALPPRSGREANALLKSAADRGPTLESVANVDFIQGQAPSDTESLSRARTRRSAKYESEHLTTPTARRAPVGALHPPRSNDGFESGNSVQSAPAERTAVGGSRGQRQPLAVAEDMILQLRARAKSRQRELA